MEKLFQYRDDNPFHISVGAVAVNAEGKILVHKTTKESIPKHLLSLLNDLPEIYELMHESLENDESLDAAVLRGLKEEFGAEGVVKRYLGAVTFMHSWAGKPFEKTILYFEAQITNQGERAKDDQQAYTELVWVEPAFLIEKMKEQAARSGRPDISESKIIEAYLKYGV